MGVRATSPVLRYELTSLAGPPSILTRALPIALPRRPIHRTEVPVKLSVAVAPTTLVCTAAPPLQPQRASAAVHPLLKASTVVSDSSTREPAGADGPVLPPPPVSP